MRIDAARYRLPLRAPLVVGAHTLTFTRDAKGFIRDEQTKSRWTMDGLCISGGHTGSQLKPLHGLQAEWYGWYATYPDTTLWKQY